MSAIHQIPYRARSSSRHSIYPWIEELPTRYKDDLIICSASEYITGHRTDSFPLISLNEGLRVKVNTSYLASWRDDTANNKPIDTSGILDMIVAYNSNFNGHDQQVSDTYPCDLHAAKLV